MRRYPSSERCQSQVTRKVSRIRTSCVLHFGDEAGFGKIRYVLVYTTTSSESRDGLYQWRGNDFMILAPLFKLHLFSVRSYSVQSEEGAPTAASTRQSSLDRYLNAPVSSFIVPVYVAKFELATAFTCDSGQKIAVMSLSGSRHTFLNKPRHRSCYCSN